MKYLLLRQFLTEIAPTYSPITSEDDMPDLQSDTLNISQAILLSQDDIPNFTQHVQSNISQAMILPPSILAQCSSSSVAEVSSNIEENGTQDVQNGDVSNQEQNLASTTYKLVGDNLDLTVKARYMRMDSRQDQSLHYFHLMSVCDRIDFSQLPITKPATCLNSPSKLAINMLPDVKSDEWTLITDLSMLVSRIIVSHIPFFNFSFSDVVTWHLKHQYYTEMSGKSTVVSSLQHN